MAGTPRRAGCGGVRVGFQLALEVELGTERGGGHTIHVGIGTKGMPAWGGALGAQVKDVVAYVLSVKDTNIAGKAAQGVDSEGNEP